MSFSFLVNYWGKPYFLFKSRLGMPLIQLGCYWESLFWEKINLLGGCSFATNLRDHRVMSASPHCGGAAPHHFLPCFQLKGEDASVYSHHSLLFLPKTIISPVQCEVNTVQDTFGFVLARADALRALVRTALACWACTVCWAPSEHPTQRWSSNTTTPNVSTMG